MSDLDIKPIEKEDAAKLKGFDISLKIDGTLVFFRNGRLHSPRCDRTERYKHIHTLLVANNFPDCVGEMFIDKPGACVFDISRKENWSKAKFMIFDICIDKPYMERKDILDKMVERLQNKFIVRMKRFKTFAEGSEYVEVMNAEGLVLRSNYGWFKWKRLQEAKVEIVKWEAMTDKGAFILANGGRVSGTSIGFVQQFRELASKGKVFAEIEFPLVTNDGNFFQPRLRRIIDEEEALRSSTKPIYAGGLK